MATDQSIDELLAAANEALAEAGFRTGDFSTARDLAEQAQAEASRAGDAASHARALNCLGMVAHYQNITMLMSGTKPGSGDIDGEERLFRQALVRWQELSRPPDEVQSGTAGPEAGQPDAGEPAADQAEAGATGPEAGQPDAAEAGAAEAGAGQAEAEAERPENAEPAAEQPDAGPREAGKPEAGQPAADQPAADQPSRPRPVASQTEIITVGTAQSLFGLGLVFQVLHSDWMTAMPYFWQALDLVSKPDAAADLYLRSEVHRHVGFYFLVEDERPSQAVRHLQLSLDLREELADPRHIPSGRQALAHAELSAGNRDRALELFGQAIAEARAAGLMPHWIEDVERDLREASGTTDAEPGPTSADADQSAPAAAETPGQSNAAGTDSEPPSADTPEPGEAPGTEGGS